MTPEKGGWGLKSNLLWMVRVYEGLWTFSEEEKAV